MKNPHLKYTLIYLALFSLISVARAEEPIDTPNPTLVLDARSLFGYSKVAGDNRGDFSTDHAWLATLGWKVSETDQLIAAYNGSFTRDNLFISQEEGARSSNKLMTQHFTGAWDHQIDETTYIKPAFFYHLIWIEETQDETLGNGLYDYDDIGGSIHVEKLYAGDYPKKSQIGFSFFKRKYPHFSSLLAAFDPNSTLEVKEKDLHGYKLDLGYQGRITDKLDGMLNAYGLLKDYTDKKTVNENGIREGNSRQDWYFELNGILSYELCERVSAGFGSSYRQNFSNLDFYDTQNSATLADDRFFDGYYDYLQYRVNPSLTFKSHDITVETPDDQPEQKPNGYHEVQVGYALEATYYHGRTALDALGGLLQEEQRDWNHTVYIDFTMPIHDNVNFLITGRYTAQDSNQKFEDFYVYNYETWSVMTGISFSN